MDSKALDLYNLVNQPTGAIRAEHGLRAQLPSLDPVQCQPVLNSSAACPLPTVPRLLQVQYTDPCTLETMKVCISADQRYISEWHKTD
jgi:hypothetical protein